MARRELEDGFGSQLRSERGWVSEQVDCSVNGSSNHTQQITRTSAPFRLMLQ